jgi:hypothetical protein
MGAPMTRAERFQKILDRALLQRRVGVVIKRKDLEDFMALVAAARQAMISEEDPAHVSALAEALSPFEETVELAD